MTGGGVVTQTQKALAALSPPCLQACFPVANIKAMRSARNRLGLVASVIAIAVLLYSPLCRLSCAASDCASLPKTKAAKPEEQSGHCHHHQDAEEQSTDSRQETDAPGPHKDQGDCPTHTDAPAVLSSAVKAPAGLHQGAPPSVVALPITAYFSFDGFAAKFAEGRPFRSPPKRAVISVYRI